MTTKGTKVGKYLVTSKIAEGGMGAIYKAKHPTLNRDVILKRLTLRRNASITERFKREAQIMLDFRDDHIVQVYDHFKEGNSYYIAMEFVDGISLSDLITKKRYIPSNIAMLIFSEICKALKYAHDRNVIHRDIKPGNVLISKNGEIKLTDFGIATSKDCEDDSLTTAGTTLGTPAYMSPEQISDTRTVDKRADIYSMGVVLYEMVTGKCPFPGSFTPEAITLIQKGEYTPPKKINPRVATVTQKIIKKAMHCKVKKRYKDLQHIIAILSRHLKKYKDQRTINDTIRQYLHGDKDTTTGNQKTDRGKTSRELFNAITIKLSSNIIRVILVIAILTGIITAGCIYFYNSGMHYEYFKHREYGALSVSVIIKNNYKKPEENYIKASLFRKVGKGYKSVKDIIFNFKVDSDYKNKKNYSLKSRKVYLKASNYRLRVNIENELYQRDFYLNPRIIQREEKISSESRIIEFYYKIARPLPLKIYFAAKNIDNNNDITGETDFYIYYYKRWLKWNDFIKLTNYKAFLITGKTYRLKFVHEGYFNKYIRLYIKSYQTILHLEVDMAPIPGKLLIKSNDTGLDILINNSEYYFSGGNHRKYKRLKPPTKKFQKLLLSPGDYFLTIKKSSSISKTDTIIIDSNKSTKVIIDYNKNKKSIDLDIY